MSVSLLLLSKSREIITQSVGKAINHINRSKLETLPFCASPATNELPSSMQKLVAAPHLFIFFS